MKHHRLLTCFAAVACSASSAVAEDGQLERVDLNQLLDPATSEAEAVALLERHDEATRKDPRFGSIKSKLRDYRLAACPQASRKELLHALLIARDLDFGRNPSSEARPTDKLDELFPARQPMRRITTPLAPPGLERLEDYWLLVLGPDGREIRTFGGWNWLSSGYLTDFNRDGIIERFDTVNYGVAEGFSVRVASLQTVERESRYLLQVLYDWHPNQVDEANEWDYECFDDDHDGLVEIGFGPKNEDRRREVVFRWDEERGAYAAPNLDRQSHIRVLRNVEPWKELEEIKAVGGLHYPLVTATPDTPRGTHSGPKTPPPPFRFRSLKDCNDEEIARFMGGRRTPDAFQPEEAPPSTVPDGFWGMEPKPAALALVKANLLPPHDRTVHLTVDTRKQARPPAAGWIVHDSRSASCYTACRSLTVLRFGIDQPFLFQTGTSRNGVVAANPLADRTGHALRMIPLSVAEARFLADILYWLNRVRGQTNEPGTPGSGGFGSSADGFGMLDWMVEKKVPRRIEGTLWAVGSLAAAWRGKFDDTACLNFTDFLLTEGLPEHLGKRWHTAPPLIHRNLTTPLPKRLQPREDSEARDQLANVIQTALERHQSDPWPAPALVALAECAGETGLSATLPALEKLAASLPAPTRRETEYRELAAKFARRFEPPKDPQGRKQWERCQALTKELRHDVPCHLRQPLADSMVKLRALGQPTRLMELAKGDGPHSLWALQQLQIQSPETYSDVLIARFRDANEWGRRTIFDTLAAAHPAGAKRLRAELTPTEQADLAVELAAFEIKDEPDLAKSRIPGLIEVFKDPSGTRDWSTRGPAIALLAELPLDATQQAQFEALLLAELKTPRRADFGISVLSRVTSAITRLPDADRHWDALVESAKTATELDEFEDLLGALAALAVTRPDPRMGQLTDFLRPRFTRHWGMMNHLFVAALALDLRAVAPEIERLATTGPDVPDGDFGNSWSSGFTGPGNRRYHAARHVSALWQESDPDVRARMWAALLVASPHCFVGDETIPKCLRDRCREAFQAATPVIRPQVVATARTAAKEWSLLADWLMDLP